MQSQVVDKLPPCTDCVAEERAEPKDAEFEVLTPTKQKSRLCHEHFMNYVEYRLGTQTVKQLVMAQRSGGGRSRNAA